MGNIKFDKILGLLEPLETDTSSMNTSMRQRTRISASIQSHSANKEERIYEWSVKAAIRMIPDLIAKGFKLVTVSELAEAKGKTLQSGNAYYYFGEGEQQVE